MRMRFVFLMLLSFCIIFAGCTDDSAKKKSENSFDLTLESCVGRKVGEVCEILGVNENELTEDLQTMRHNFNSAVTYDGHSFTRYLCFGDNNGKKVLYGGGYECLLESKGEELSELVDSLKNMLIDTYGEPTTYPGHGSILGDERDFSSYVFEDFIEDWSANDSKGGEIRLTVRVRDERAMITVQYSASAY